MASQKNSSVIFRGISLNDRWETALVDYFNQIVHPFLYYKNILFPRFIEEEFQNRSGT